MLTTVIVSTGQVLSLELMKDPVVVSTGQVLSQITCVWHCYDSIRYEFIHKLSTFFCKYMKDASFKTCPETLQHTTLTPNYVLKSLIALWCGSNGVELRKKQGSCRTRV